MIWVYLFGALVSYTVATVYSAQAIRENADDFFDALLLCLISGMGAVMIAGLWPLVAPVVAATFWHKWSEWSKRVREAL